MRGEDQDQSGFGLRALAFIIWFGFITFCIGLNQSHGLSYADDAWLAIIAKSLASGVGYATTFPVSGESGHPILFNPSTGTGPTLIVPCALAFAILGKSEVLPGLIAILTWGSLFTFLLVRISQRIDPGSFLLGVCILCAAFVATFAFHFEQWYAFLGEIVAAAFIIVAHWVLANERFNGLGTFVSGLALGLAFQAKFLAMVAAPGLFLIFCVRTWRMDCRPSQCFRHIAALLIGFLVPILAFEVYKWIQLGPHGYVLNWRNLLTATREMGMQRDGHWTWSSLQQRLGLVDERFGLQLIGFLALNAFGMFLTWRSATKPWTLFSVGILFSITTLAVYWSTLSIGWARYLVICIAMGTFLLCIPIFTLAWGRKLLFTLLVLFVLRTGFSRAGNIVASIDRGIFRPTSERVARMVLVKMIEQRQKEEPIILVARWWGSMTDVEFMLPGNMNFQKLETVIELPEPKLVLLNHHFDPSPDKEIERIRATKSSILFAEGPYELLEVR